MRKLIVLSVFIAHASCTLAQQFDLNKIADSIRAAGLVLYQSEMASWYGTDIFMEKCKDKKETIGGYLSYDTGHGENNIFFSKGNNPVVLGTISFGYDFNPQNYKLDTAGRPLSRQENELYVIRQKALSEVNRDTLFKHYNHATLNLVPIIDKGEKQVYLLTGPEVSGVVLLGNDYVLNFDGNDNITEKRKIHKSLIVINYAKTVADSNKTVLSSIHTHLASTGDFITATDICTLMLYEKFTTWNQHIVLSGKYASVWNCKNNTLAIFKKEDWQNSNPVRKALEASKN